jgi:hypothetical protein
MSVQLRVVRPRHVNRSVPARPANAELRTREYLTPAEVEKLIKEARQGRCFGMGCGARKSVIWNGPKSSSADPPPCTSGASRIASRASTLFAATKQGTARIAPAISRLGHRLCDRAPICAISFAGPPHRSTRATREACRFACGQDGELQGARWGSHGGRRHAPAPIESAWWVPLSSATSRPAIWRRTRAVTTTVPGSASELAPTFSGIGPGRGS